MRRLTALVVVVGALLGARGAPGATAQGTTGDEPTASAAVSVVASGLVNPRGFAFDGAGRLVVALGGEPEVGAGIVTIEDGCPRTVVGGQPTSRVAFGATAGVADVAVVDGQLYALVAGGNIDDGGQPNGVYRLGEDDDLELIANISTFIRDNPVAEKPGDYDTDGQPYALLPDQESFLVTEGNSNQLLRVSLDGTVSRLADLSAGHPIPTGIAPAPDGGVYVALFTQAPYEEGTAKVIRVAADGSREDVWTGLSLVTALAVDEEGTLFATEMATGYGDDASAIAPGTGRIVRQTGLASSAVVVTGLALPIALEFGPEGALFVGGPAFGADDGSGVILRIARSASEAVAVPSELFVEQPCG